MKKYTKVLTLLLGVGIGIGASGIMGNGSKAGQAYANDGVGYSNLSGNYEESKEYNEGYRGRGSCFTGGSKGCDRRGYDSYQQESYRNNNVERDAVNQSGEL